MMALVARLAPRPKPIAFISLRSATQRPRKIIFRGCTANHGKSLQQVTKCMVQGSRNYGFKEKSTNEKSLVPIESAASVSALENHKDSDFGRIVLSETAVKTRRNVYWGRKWNFWDIYRLGIVGAMHLLCLSAPFTFKWGAFWVAVALYVITGLLGVTLSFHRNLSHGSFKLPKWLEYFFAYCGVLAVQGDPIEWVSNHRYHHQFCDTEKDPHSPMGGFWFSHMSWIFDTQTIVEKCGGPNNVRDLEKQFYYKFLQKTYIAHPIAFAALLYAIGGLPFVVWGMVAGTFYIWRGLAQQSPCF